MEQDETKLSYTEAWARAEELLRLIQTEIKKFPEYCHKDFRGIIVRGLVLRGENKELEELREKRKQNPRHKQT